MVVMVVSGRRGLGGKDGGMSLFIIIQSGLVFLRSCSGIQESSLAEYPFHQIRKDHWDGEPLWHKIWSILYSSSPAIRSGGEVGKFGLYTSFLQ